MVGRVAIRYSVSAMPRFALILVCWLAFAALASAGEAEGVAAFDRGNYETAMGEFRPLAE